MAGFSKSTWKGFYSSTPAARKLPARRTVDARLAGVDERVRHLRHLRAIQEAMEVLEDEEVAHPARNPEISGVLGDPFAGRGGLTDIFGNAIDIGHTGDSLRDEYGPGHVPGEHGNDPGDPRGSWRHGIAKQDEAQETGTEEEDDYHFAVLAADAWSLALAEAEMKLASLLATAEKMGKKPNQNLLEHYQHELRETRAMYDRAMKDWVTALRRLQAKRASLPKGKGDDKPRPDNEGASRPTTKQWLEIQKRLGGLLTWGDPSTDFKLERAAPGHLTAEVVQALWDLRTGGNPAMYDRLGNLARQRRRMTEQELRQMLYQLRISHPAINWGEAGPPPPPRTARAPAASFGGRLRAGTDTGNTPRDEEDA